MVFGIIYGTGFGLGAAAWTAFHHGNYTSLLEWAAERWGNAAGIATLVLGTLLACLCFLIRWWGTSYLRSAIVWNANARTDVMIIDGPLRFTRNPLYLGNILLAAGIGVVATPLGWLLLLILHVIFIHMLIRWEERGLQERFGVSFRCYCDSVPRLLPALKPGPVENPVMPDFREGLQAELFAFSCFLAMLSLFLPIPIPENTYLFWAIMVAGALIQVALVRWLRRASTMPD
jgi:protein-S-isoprenylcysteine O-methyltransferase Ste14